VKPICATKRFGFARASWPDNAGLPPSAPIRVREDLGPSSYDARRCPSTAEGAPAAIVEVDPSRRRGVETTCAGRSVFCDRGGTVICAPDLDVPQRRYAPEDRLVVESTGAVEPRVRCCTRHAVAYVSHAAVASGMHDSTSRTDRLENGPCSAPRRKAALASLAWFLTTTRPGRDRRRCCRWPSDPQLEGGVET